MDGTRVRGTVTSEGSIVIYSTPLELHESIKTAIEATGLLIGNENNAKAVCVPLPRDRQEVHLPSHSPSPSHSEFAHQDKLIFNVSGFPRVSAGPVFVEVT